MRTLPMLCQSRDVYRGPYIPTDGLKGHVHAEGLLEADILEVVGIGRDKSVTELGQLHCGVEAVIFDAGKFAYVRVVRTETSGSPIDVWVA